MLLDRAIGYTVDDYIGFIANIHGEIDSFQDERQRVNEMIQGGIYLDNDAEILRNWDELLKSEMFCGFLNHVLRINTGLGFGAVKGMK